MMAAAAPQAHLTAHTAPRGMGSGGSVLKKLAAGGVWDAECKLWRLLKSTIRKLNLTQRIATENA